MSGKLTFWFEFASTYSFLSAMRIEPLADAAGVEVDWCPFLLGPILKAQGLDSSPFNVFPVKGRNMWRDIERQAMKYGLAPPTFPEPFPQNGLLAARVMLIGKDLGWYKTFTKLVFSAEFQDGQNIGDDGGIAGILRAMSLDADDIILQAKTDDTIKAQLRENTNTALELGIFGAPSFVTQDGELFWGNDRLEDALQWAVKVHKER